MEQNNPGENFKALLLCGSVYYMASQNSPSECFQAICHNYNGDLKKKVFNVFSCVATQTSKPFLGCALLSQMFLGVKQKPKCKAVDVTEQEAILAQGVQADYLIVRNFSLIQSCRVQKRKRSSALLQSTIFHLYVFKYSILVEEKKNIMRFL